MTKGSPSPKRNRLKGATIGVAAFALVAVGGGLAVQAGFTDSGTTNVTVSSGTLSLTLGGSSNYTVDFGNALKPGDSVSKVIAVKNAGTLPLTYTAGVTGTAGPLASKLDVVITPGTTALASKKLNVATIPTQTIAPGATQNVTMVVSWPASDTNPNASMGTNGNVTLKFDATQ